MGVYLNSRKPHDNYRKVVDSTYFVDKSSLLYHLIPIVEVPKGALMPEGENKGKSYEYICITRPRRFGKTVMANMIAAFFGKGQDSWDLFGNLEIQHYSHVNKHLNQHNVIYISFNELPRNCKSYQEYIDRIQNRLIKDLKKAYPNAEIEDEDAVWDVLNNIYELVQADKFIFVMDEWDYIFHRDFVTEKDKKSYIDFLSNLLKDQPYVEMAYMTGILPIAKYSSGSELNMFCEYTMVNEEKYSEFFGFTESEVDDIYSRYQELNAEHNVTREGLRFWYNGYHTRSGERVYNPRSVVLSLINNNMGNYWTSAGPYDEIFFYIQRNIAAVRDELALMVSGIPVQAKVREYAATSMNLTTKDEIFSAMVVYGFLSYENGYVSIPNKELMNKFNEMLVKEHSLGYMNRLAKESDKMLTATKAGNTGIMCDILEYAHNTESPLLSYNDETDLTALVNLIYLSARDSYRVEREDKSGIGYVDFIFYPEIDRSNDGIILELKVDHTAEEAIQQIKDRQYILKFTGKLGEDTRYTGRILAVGIAYDKKTKKHQCKVEVLRGAIDK